MLCQIPTFLCYVKYQPFYNTYIVIPYICCKFLNQNTEYISLGFHHDVICKYDPLGAKLCYCTEGSACRVACFLLQMKSIKNLRLILHFVSVQLLLVWPVKTFRGCQMTHSLVHSELELLSLPSSLYPSLPPLSHPAISSVRTEDHLF